MQLTQSKWWRGAAGALLVHLLVIVFNNMPTRAQSNGMVRFTFFETCGVCPTALLASVVGVTVMELYARDAGVPAARFTLHFIGFMASSGSRRTFTTVARGVLSRIASPQFTHQRYASGLVVLPRAALAVGRYPTLPSVIDTAFTFLTKGA